MRYEKNDNYIKKIPSTSQGVYMFNDEGLVVAADANMNNLSNISTHKIFVVNDNIVAMIIGFQGFNDGILHDLANDNFTLKYRLHNIFWLLRKHMLKACRKSDYPTNSDGEIILSLFVFERRENGFYPYHLQATIDEDNEVHIGIAYEEDFVSLFGKVHTHGRYMNELKSNTDLKAIPHAMNKALSKSKDIISYAINLDEPNSNKCVSAPIDWICMYRDGHTVVSNELLRFQTK